MLPLHLIHYPNCCRCPEPVAGSIEVYVDVPPTLSEASDYAIFVRGLYAKHPKQWVRLPFCTAHLKEQVERGEIEMDDDRLWSPKADHPGFFIAEPRMIKANGKAVQEN